MAAAQRQKVDEPKAEARVRLPNVEGPMTKVGLPNAGAGENTVVRYDEGWIAECRAAVDSLSGKRTADAVSAVYEDVIRWQTRHCISCIPRRHFNADKEERCLANRLAVVLRRRKRRLAWMSDEVSRSRDDAQDVWHAGQDVWHAGQSSQRRRQTSSIAFLALVPLNAHGSQARAGRSSQRCRQTSSIALLVFRATT